LTIAFIGAGNMAISLIRGLLENGTEATAIVAADPNPEQRMKAADLGITTLEDNNAAIHQAEVIVLAVKPQIAANVVKSLDSINPQHLVISIAAGINLESLQSWLPNHQPVVRCMPNTPALVGAGMTALYPNAAVSPTHLRAAEHVLQAAGKIVWVNEEAKLDAVTAVSGSGPAYFFLLMEHMINAGIELGLDAQTSKELTLQTAYGAALMAQQAPEPVATLRENVTSPAGTTEAALNKMLEQHVPEAVVSALHAAHQRSIELAKEFGNP
jgi:pyrroline-5-carboxylate reductase